jgi:hypothetical protein
LFGFRNNPMGSNNPIVDPIGHPHLDGKTLLFLVSGFCGSDNAITKVLRFRSLDINRTASLLASRNPIAIDLAAVDILRNGPLVVNNITGQGVDNYLHEGAQAGDPPSGSASTDLARPVSASTSTGTTRWAGCTSVIERRPSLSSDVEASEGSPETKQHP